MTSATTLYRKYKDLSDDIFDPVPEYSGQGDDIRKLVQARRKALRCADLRAKYTHFYVPQDQRDQNHEKVIDHLINKASQCKTILDSTKPPVQKCDPHGSFPYIDLNQPQPSHVTTITRTKSTKRRSNELPQIQQPQNDKADNDILASVAVVPEDENIKYIKARIQKLHNDLNHSNMMRKHWLACEVVGNTCRNNKFNFPEYVKCHIAYMVSGHSYKECEKCPQCDQNRYRVFMEDLKDPIFVLEAGLDVMRTGVTTKWRNFAYKIRMKMEELDDLHKMLEDSDSEDSSDYYSSDYSSEYSEDATDDSSDDE